MIYTQNKKARHDYEILETFEAGIILEGPEVKSIRKSNINLLGSYVIIKNKMLYLVGAHISKPSHIGVISFDETRDRILLTSKKERLKLKQKLKVKGLTIVALKVYQPDTSKKIKVQIALVKGKKNYDKREALKAKTQERDTKIALKNY